MNRIQLPAALIVASLIPTVAHGQGALGDECGAPLAISGATVVPYNPADYTASAEPFNNSSGCLSPVIQHWRNDIWLCWTADCTGLATIGLCTGPVPGGSHMAMWSGCACPGDTPPLCCSDDGCPGQPGYAIMQCEVVCGQQYLIRASSDFAMQVQMFLTTDCAGTPCGGGQKPNPHGPGSECGDCCQGGPSVTGFGGTVLLSTDYGDTPASFVLHAYDLTTPPAAPAIWAPPRYEHASWTRTHLGTVFGVTTDDGGNIYLSHGAFFNVDTPGAVGGGTGAVIRIDGSTGVASLVETLPQSPASTGKKGLGNITWSCTHDSLYVTNFEDGRIYRIDPSALPGSRIKSAYDAATDTLDLSGNPEAGDAAGIVPKGERVWAVAVGGDRLFYSIWSRDLSNPLGSPNTVWSIALNASGDPVPGTATLEIVLNAPGLQVTPVADLAFNADCCLYLAQRSMTEDIAGIQTDSHDSDLLKYCWEPGPVGAGGTWVQSGTFLIGDSTAFGLQHSSAGGVGVDNSPGGLVWATGDALNLSSAAVYGIQGLPQTGGDTTNSLIIDNDNEIFSQDKGGQGSCEVICAVAPSCSVEVEDVHCLLGPDGYPSGEYSVTVTVHNDSGQTVNLLLLPTLGTFQYLDPPLQTGHSVTLKVVVSGNAGDLISIPIGLFDGTTHCCGVKAEFVLPVCTCVLFTEVTVSCHPDGDPTTYQYDISFTLHNISTNPSFIATWFFLLPPPGAPYFFTPTVGNVFPLLPGGQTSVGPIALSFTVPPVAGPNGQWQLVVPVSLHNANLAICCDSVLVLHGPIPCEPSCSPDLSGDGIVNGADLGILLGAWGPGGAGTCADLNGDGVVNGNDLGVLLGAWS